MFNLFKQSLSWHKLVRAQTSGVACGYMFSIVFIKPLLQDTQNVLLLQQKPALQVTKAAVYGKGVTAVFKRGQIGIAELEVTHCW